MLQVQLFLINWDKCRTITISPMPSVFFKEKHPVPKNVIFKNFNIQYQVVLSCEVMKLIP